MALMAIYTPTYRQVLTGMDLNFPVALSFSPYGKSVMGPGFNTHQGGFFNIGANVSYRDANQFVVTYQRFFGHQAGGTIPGDPGNLNQNRPSWGQSSGDRNYIAFSIYRSFGVRASQKNIQ
jgi:hypothetical protein